MKRLVSILLVLILILASSASVFAASADPNINIVNPAGDSTITSSSLLISVKILTPETIKVHVYKDTSSTSTPAWSAIYNSDPYVSTSNLSFFTKKLENIADGTYLVRVDTLGSDNSVIYQTYRKVTVKAKTQSDASVFQKSSANSGFLSSLLKSIFG